MLDSVLYYNKGMQVDSSDLPILSPKMEKTFIFD